MLESVWVAGVQHTQSHSWPLDTARPLLPPLPRLAALILTNVPHLEKHNPVLYPPSAAPTAGNHIRLMLPTLRRQISEALEAKSAELAGYGPPLDLGSEAAR